MNWRNVRLIFAREIRDQLRDRRTLFMIAVLPLLLYPLLGGSIFQLTQFMRKHAATVVVIGAEQLSEVPDLPPLIVDDEFVTGSLGRASAEGRLQVELLPESSPDIAATDADVNVPLDLARRRLASGEVDVVLRFPPGFAENLRLLRQEVNRRAAGGEISDEEVAVQADAAQPEILFSSGREKSRITHHRVQRTLEEWRARVVQDNLIASRVPLNFARPFAIEPTDIAERRQRDAVLWSKILPLVLFIWALTGAFYPAVDLCAGEKERGTLETLLASPARRTEIVWGKLLTVMTFSATTAVLNLLSLGVTARYVISQLRAVDSLGDAASLSLPPLFSLLWLFLALVPISAMFSALCLACASFARSTKEGQYYLMPLLLVMMPLMLLPTSPGVELNLGNSLVPVTGMVLLMRALIESRYVEALPYVLPVVGVTAICCLLAIRWAVEQFQRESVLFRESERLDLRRWVVHLVRDRAPTPSLAEAFTCIALILVTQFFINLAFTAQAPANPDFAYLVKMITIPQLVCIALPAMLMTVLLTGQPWKTLLLDRLPSASTCVVAVLLACLLHPVGQQLALWINRAYPVSEEVVASGKTMIRLLESAPYAWMPFLLIAVLPAICEEVAFRGFILSGLRRLGHKWWAIVLSAIFFGMAHTVLQQSLAAAAVGVAIGYLAVQTGSLVPCMLFHMTYNGLNVLLIQWKELPDRIVERVPALRWALTDVGPNETNYSMTLVAICAVLAAGLFVWLYRLPCRQSDEEQFRALLDRQEGATPPMAVVPANPNS